MSSLSEFCWVELAALDKQAAQAFYAELFGWTALEQPFGLPSGRVIAYATLWLEGQPGGAAYELIPEQTEGGLAPHWLPYVAVESVDRATQLAERLGGTPLFDPTDVFDAGRMSIIEDPGGARLGLWQAKSLAGFGAGHAPGKPCWFELRTEDPERARKFYSALFGWTRSHPAAGAAGARIGKDERALASVTGLTGEAPTPGWTTHFAVASCADSRALLQAKGGRVEGEPVELPGIGRRLAARDPQGAAFALLEPRFG